MQFRYLTAAAVASAAAPVPVPVLVPVLVSCSDIGRTSLLYETPNYESGVVSSFLPVPLSGAFGAAQFSTVNGAAALYERTSVIGVWRALPQPDSSSRDSSAAAAGSSGNATVTDSSSGNATTDGGDKTGTGNAQQ